MSHHDRYVEAVEREYVLEIRSGEIFCKEGGSKGGEANFALATE